MFTEETEFHSGSKLIIKHIGVPLIEINRNMKLRNESHSDCERNQTTNATLLIRTLICVGKAELKHAYHVSLTPPGRQMPDRTRGCSPAEPRGSSTHAGCRLETGDRSESVTVPVRTDHVAVHTLSALFFSFLFCDYIIRRTYRSRQHTSCCQESRAFT